MYCVTAVKGASPKEKTPDGRTYLEAAESDEQRQLLKQYGA